MKILVLSCQLYSGLWEPFFTLFFRYWKDCPYMTNLCSDFTEDWNFNGVNVIKSDQPAESWNYVSRLKYYLSRIEDDFVIITQDDYMLASPVKTEEVEECLQLMIDNPNICSIRLSSDVPGKGSLYYSSSNFNLTKYSLDQDYWMNQQTSMWRKDILVEICNNIDTNDGTVNNLEMIGTTYLKNNHSDKIILGLQDKSYNIIDYLYSGLVAGGRLEKFAYPFLEKEKISIKLYGDGSIFPENSDNINKLSHICKLRRENIK